MLSESIICVSYVCQHNFNNMYPGCGADNNPDIFHFLQLLQKDKRNRLGVQNDFMDIRTHPFFGPINWQLLDERKIKPPYNPNVVSIERS